MKNFSKEKRDRIVLIIIGTAVILVAGWYLGINTQKRSLDKAEKAISDQRLKVDNGNRLLGSRSAINERVKVASVRLKDLESQMAAGDMYSWIILKVNKFKAAYNVDIPQFTREVTGEVEVLPNFPYKAATFTVRGTAFFHDFGVFLADFENAFPYMRVQNLEMEPAVISAASGPPKETVHSDESEKISFHMEIVALINPGLN